MMEENGTESTQHSIMPQRKKLPRTFSEVELFPYFPIIVESIDPRNTSNDIMKQVKDGIDVVELGIGINHIKKARNQKVLIGCESEEDRNILQDRLKHTTDNLKVYRPATRNPLLRLTGVVFDLSNGKIEEAIIKQNTTLLSDITAAATSSTCNIILEIEDDVCKISTYASILNEDHIIFGGDINAKSPWWGCNVEDGAPSSEAD
ncbi:unnamed protein product [Parnassius apollo]|uniref:(apollo) hypothetical protein n=1 Tax=Parnassius apollo TaxID=110799 RepID=A0A8S3W4E5_PARAO|nr:unnamed protein product [Parnassius apollo]